MATNRTLKALFLHGEMKLLRLLVGLAVLAVPDARGSPTTLEANASITAGERLVRFGQVDHFRRFGRDFPNMLISHGFAVERIEIGEWYARRGLEARLYLNEEYDPTQPFYFSELVFMAQKPVRKALQSVAGP